MVASAVMLTSGEPYVEAAELVGREEARAGERGLGAEHAVELDGVAAGLVDLQRDLGAVEDDGRDAGRAGLGAQQRCGFFGDALGVAGEVLALDELPALGALVAADAVRVGAVLHFALVDGGGLDAAAGLVRVPARCRRPRCCRRSSPRAGSRGCPRPRRCSALPSWSRSRAAAGRSCRRARRRTGPSGRACGTCPDGGLRRADVGLRAATRADAFATRTASAATRSASSSVILWLPAKPQ